MIFLNCMKMAECQYYSAILFTSTGYLFELFAVVVEIIGAVVAVHIQHNIGCEFTRRPIQSTSANS